MQVIKRTGPRRKRIWEIPIEPLEFTLKPIKKRVAIFDTETDPFKEGRIVKPFTCGFYLTDTGDYIDFWGRDCVDQFFRYLAREFEADELVIFCHNFGNFDAYFILDYLDSGTSPFIINGRLVRIEAQGQEFRDSYAMLPFTLAEYQKDKIDYNLLEEDVREDHKDEILSYQKSDCIYLSELVLEWLSIYGDRLTIASAALPHLRKHQNFESLSEKLDSELRPFYFGGRTQCFSVGVHTGDFKVYDINSSYSKVMKDYLHPISDTPIYETRITERTHFAFIRAWSCGALPIRKPDGGLDFPIGVFDFYANRHEIKAGLATGTLRILKCYYSLYFREEANFSGFVDEFYSKKEDAAIRGDGARKACYKSGLVSPYGKLAQDPRKYENWLFDPDVVPTPLFCEKCYEGHRNNSPVSDCLLCLSEGPNKTSAWGWYLHTTRNGQNIYASPQRIRASGFFNVATAASITSAARAELLYGIKAATRPIYCDTDSIICEGLSSDDPRIVMDATALGAWDLEATGDTVCIAGKKLYAIFQDDVEVKKASKGVKLTADEIRRVCEGEVIEYANPVPKFSLGIDNLDPDLSEDVKRKMFITRAIRRTG